MARPRAIQVKAFFDTSVLVPVFYGDHERHPASLSLFLQFTKAEACCGAHTLAEIYSTLTRMPGKYRVTGDQAMLFVGSVLERLTIIALSAEEYATALHLWSQVGVTGRDHLRCPARVVCPQSTGRGDLFLESAALWRVGSRG
jgi:hypothetical protein